MRVRVKDDELAAAVGCAKGDVVDLPLERGHAAVATRKAELVMRVKLESDRSLGPMHQAAGDVIDVSFDEGRRLIDRREATLVRDQRVETATRQPTETAVRRTRRRG